MSNVVMLMSSRRVTNVEVPYGNVIDIEHNSTTKGAPLDAFTPETLSASLNGPAQFAASQSWEIEPDPLGSSHHIIKNPHTRFCIEIANDAQTPGAVLHTWPVKTSENANQLWDFLPDPFGSAACFIQNPNTGLVIEIKHGSSDAGAALDLGRRRLFDNDHQLWTALSPYLGGFDGTGLSAANVPQLTLASAPVSPPDAFGSNNQYVLLSPSDASTNLTRVVVTLDVIEDIVTDTFELQVNCNAPWPTNGRGNTFDAQWLQFAFVMQNNKLALWNQAWHAKGADKKGDPLATKGLSSATLFELQNNTVPAGTRLELTLVIDPDHNDFCTGAIGSVYVNGTLQAGPTPWSFINQPTYNPGGPATEADLSPVSAVTAVVVGPPDGQTTFSSGMGTLTIDCEPAVTIGGPNGPNLHPIQGCETSNMYYGQVQAGPTKQIVQPFGIPSPRITGVSGSYIITGAGLYPNSRLKVRSRFLIVNTEQEIEGSSLPDLVSADDGSFSFEIYLPTNEVEYTLTYMWVTVSDAAGNVASGKIEIDPDSSQGAHLVNSTGTPRPSPPHYC